MKSEEDPHEPMAPDIHGECGAQHPGEPMAPGIHGEHYAQRPGPAAFWRQQCFQEGPSHLCFFIKFLGYTVSLLTNVLYQNGYFLEVTCGLLCWRNFSWLRSNPK